MDNQETNENAKRPLTTFDLICAAKSFERSLERAEGVVDDDFEQALADFFADDDVEDKIKKCRYVLQRFAVEAQTLKDEANRLTDKRRSIEAKRGISKAALSSLSKRRSVYRTRKPTSVTRIA